MGGWVVSGGGNMEVQIDRLGLVDGDVVVCVGMMDSG